MYSISLDFDLPLESTVFFEIAQSNLPEIVGSIRTVNHLDRTTNSTNSAVSFTDRWRILIPQALPGLLSEFVELEDVDACSKSHWYWEERLILFKIFGSDLKDILKECHGIINALDLDSGTIVQIKCHFELNLQGVPSLSGTVLSFLTDQIEEITEQIVSSYLPEIKNTITKKSTNLSLAIS